MLRLRRKRCGHSPNDVALRANIWYNLNEVSIMISDIWGWIVENKDFLIALIALILTVLQLIVSFIKNREKYKIFADKIELITIENKKVLLINMSIVNYSSSTLNITKMHFINKNDRVLCNLNKTWSGEHYYPKFPETDIPRTERIFSVQFPISVQPNGAASVLIRFESINDFVIYDNLLKVEVSTSKTVRKILIKC